MRKLTRDPDPKCQKWASHIDETWVGTSWIVKLAAIGRRNSKAFQALHVFLTSLRITQEALLQRVRDRWGIEGWQWIRDGHAANRSSQPAATGGVSVDPRRHTGGDARHHCAAGDGATEVSTQPMLSL